MAGIGQASNRATPLQMAMVAAAVANDGKLMKPYMVDQLQAPNLDVLSKTQPEQMSQPMSAANAQKLQKMMEFVVTDGTGTSAPDPRRDRRRQDRYRPARRRQQGNPYAWFISYAKPGDGSPVAVAVVIEGSDTTRDDIAGGKLAAPIAKDVMKAVLDSKK